MKNNKKHHFQKQCKSRCKPFQDNFKDESPLILSIFAMINIAMLILKRRTKLRLRAKPQSACGGGDDEWQHILTAMSMSIEKDIEFDFSAFEGWGGLSAERAVEMINHLPPSIERLVIWCAPPYGSPFMDAVIDWIEKSKNLKTLSIWNTSVGGRNVDDGRDTGIRLAKTLAAKNTIKRLWLYETDLMGSRNVDEWSKAFDKMTSLKILRCEGMKSYIKDVDESTFDEKTSTVTAVYPFDERQRIYWKDNTFPDATMKEEDVQKLKEATHATNVEIDDMIQCAA